VNVSSAPLGQRMLTSVTTLSVPSPKWAPMKLMWEKPSPLRMSMRHLPR